MRSLPAVLLVVFLGQAHPLAAQGSSGSPADRVTERARTPEAQLYVRAQRSVFRVEAGISHGSGFLIDAAKGWVVTNDHVVGTRAGQLSVYLDSVTRVPARLVAREPDADVAVVQIAPEACGECAALHLAAAGDGDAGVVPGDRVLALGFPLNQPLTITGGLISAIRRTALVTDAVINPGNSGGPLCNVDGDVVGVNTFRDVDDRGVGPGLSGAVRLDAIRRVLARAASVDGSPPAPMHLPVVPLVGYPLAPLKSMADTATADVYKQFLGINAGPFTVNVATPLSQLVTAIGIERDVAKDRRKRETKAGVEMSERYSEVGELREWAEYVGSTGAPVISISITPEQGETFGSKLKGALGAAAGTWAQTTMRFKGDVAGVTVRREGQPIEPLRSGHGPIRLTIDNPFLNLKDVADFGVVILAPEIFAPLPNGQPPQIMLEIADLKHPDTPAKLTLDRVVVARAWNDFEAFYRQERPGQAFTRVAISKTCTGSSATTSSGTLASATEGGVCSYVVPPPTMRTP